MKQYNGVPLDGRPMSIQMATSDLAPVSPAPRRISGGGVGAGVPQGKRRSVGRVEKPTRGRGGAARGAGRGGRGGRGAGGRGGAKKQPPPSAEDLDKELDTYRNAR